MQLQFEKKELSCLGQAVRSVKDQELTQEVRLTGDLPDVGRVLAGWGQVILRGKEWQGSRMAASGGVQATILYAPEDGSEPRTVETWIPFQLKWDAGETDREGPMRVMPLVRFVDGRNLSARKILVRAGVSCLGEGLREQRAAVFSPPEVPEDVQLLRRTYPVRLPREAGEKTFSLEQTLDPAGKPIAEILSYTIQPEVSECRVSADKVILRGLGRLHLVYRCAEGRIRTRNIEIPFSQLGELEKEYPGDAMADAMVAVTGLELEMAEGNLELKCNLVAQYLVSDRTMVELVEDAYSPRREVGIRQEELYLPLILDETRERVSPKSSVPDTGLDPADSIFWPGFPQVRREGDRAEVELPGRFQILGYDQEGNLRSDSVRWEGRTGLDVDTLSRVDAVFQPAGDLQWDGMELRSDGELRMVTQSRRGMPMITALEFGPLREQDPMRPSLVLCRGSGRSLWSIARASGSTVSAICDANGLDEDPQDNRMLLIPVS